MKISSAQTVVSFQGAFVDFRDGILLNQVGREEFRPQSSAPRFPFMETWFTGRGRYQSDKMSEFYIILLLLFYPVRQTTTGLAESPTLSGYVSFIFTTECSCGSRLVVWQRHEKLKLREWHAGSPCNLASIFSFHVQ